MTTERKPLSISSPNSRRYTSTEHTAPGLTVEEETKILTDRDARMCVDLRWINRDALTPSLIKSTGRNYTHIGICGMHPVASTTSDLRGTAACFVVDSGIYDNSWEFMTRFNKEVVDKIKLSRGRALLFTALIGYEHRITMVIVDKTPGDKREIYIKKPTSIASRLDCEFPVIPVLTKPRMVKKRTEFGILPTFYEIVGNIRSLLKRGYINIHEEGDLEEIYADDEAKIPVFHNDIVIHWKSPGLVIDTNKVRDYTMTPKACADAGMNYNEALEMCGQEAMEDSNYKDMLEKTMTKKACLRIGKELKGDYIMTLNKREYNPETEEADIVPGFPEFKVKITGRPGSTKCGKKHVYLCAPKDYGKTYGLTEFAKEYDAVIITNISNLAGVRRNSQFILMDEAESIAKIDLATLKAVTSGNASTGSFNRKSHGEDFVPRADAQFVFFSNQSLMKQITEYDETLCRHIASEENVEIMKKRFTLYEIEPKDYLYVTPKLLSDEDMSRFMQHLFKKHFNTAHENGNYYGLINFYLQAGRECDFIDGGDLPRWIEKMCPAKLVAEKNKTLTGFTWDMMRGMVGDRRTNRMEAFMDRLKSSLWVRNRVLDMHSALAMYEHEEKSSKKYEAAIKDYVWNILCKDNPEDAPHVLQQLQRHRELKGIWAETIYWKGKRKELSPEFIKAMANLFIDFGRRNGTIREDFGIEEMSNITKMMEEFDKTPQAELDMVEAERRDEGLYKSMKEKVADWSQERKEMMVARFAQACGVDLYNLKRKRICHDDDDEKETNADDEVTPPPSKFSKGDVASDAPSMTDIYDEDDRIYCRSIFNPPCTYCYCK